MIDEIDHDVKIVPRGAYVKSPTGQVSCNRSFEGLEISRSYEPSESERARVYIITIMSEENNIQVLMTLLYTSFLAWQYRSRFVCSRSGKIVQLPSLP